MRDGDPSRIVQDLSHAYLHFGELCVEQFFTPPASKKVKSGWDSKYSLGPEDKNWLVCRYGGDVQPPSSTSIGTS
jgi:hypothetical protein